MFDYFEMGVLFVQDVEYIVDISIGNFGLQVFDFDVFQVGNGKFWEDFEGCDVFQVFVFFEGFGFY